MQNLGIMIIWINICEGTMAFVYYVLKYMYLATMLKAIEHLCTPNVRKQCI